MRRRVLARRALAALLLAAAAGRALPNAPAAKLPEPLPRIGYDQRLGARLPLDLPFRDEAGRAVRLGDYFGRRPAVLVLAYFRCPMLCDVVLAGLASSLKVLAFDAGRQFDVVVVSFDPKDTPALAAATKQKALARYGHPGAAAGWHFLTGAQESISAVTRAVGFRYAYDPRLDQFAHAAGIVITTPEGRLSRYLYGIEYPPRDVRLSLIESADHRIGSPVDQLLLYCFHYDPATGRYSAMILNVLRLAAAATLAGLVVMIVLLRWRERRTSPGGSVPVCPAQPTGSAPAVQKNAHTKEASRGKRARGARTPA
jgi:protein SCO1